MSKIDFPNYWELTKLGSVCSHPQYGYTTKASDTGNVKFLRTTDITKGSLDWSKVPFCLEPPKDISKYQLEDRDIVISRAGSIGFSSLLQNPPDNSIFASYLIRFRPLSLINERYLKYFLESDFYWSQLVERSAGNAVQNVNAQKLADLNLIVASLAEQQQIVAKLDELLAQVDTLKTRLDTIPKILKRLRQSVLAAAVSGKLTEDWRGTKPLGSVVTIGEVASDIRYGTSKKCDYETGNIPVIRIPNIDNGFLNLTDLKFADFDEKELKNLSLVVGDLLLIRSNGSVDLVGKTALITEKDVHCLYAGYLIRIRLNQQMVMPKYLLYCLQSLQIRKVIEIQARSTSGVNNINSKELAALKFLLPHLEEQTEIVNRVEQLFTYADQIEQRVKNAQTRVNHLTKAILAKAFRGELTAEWREQNLDLISGENSAEALLARIKEERQLLEHNKVTNRATIKKSGESMKPRGILPIIEVLKVAGQPLSSQDLLVQSSYPSDAGTEQLEAFFLDIREQLNAKTITRNRQGDQEFFSIVE